MGYISSICTQAPHGGISTKFCTAVEVVDVIICDNFLVIGRFCGVGRKCRVPID